MSLALAPKPASLYTESPFSGRYRTTKERFHEYLDAEKQEGACQETTKGDPDEPGAKRIRLEDKQENGKAEAAAESHERQVPKRARGQNKSRPHMKPACYDKERLCPSLLQVRVALQDWLRVCRCCAVTNTRDPWSSGTRPSSALT